MARRFAAGRVGLRAVEAPGSSAWDRELRRLGVSDTVAVREIERKTPAGAALRTFALRRSHLYFVPEEILDVLRIRGEVEGMVAGGLGLQNGKRARRVQLLRENSVKAPER